MSDINKVVAVFPKEVILNERYRPNKISDCILKPDAKEVFLNIVKTDKLGNMLFYGPAGTGKTTVAKALCEEMGIEWILINASSERTLDIIRTQIRTFASTSSFTGKRKCVILDEADNLPEMTQTAFRASIEEYSQNCSFIFTCNYPNKIIDPLKSRLVGIDFGVDTNTELTLKYETFVRICGILENEQIEYDEDVLLSLVTELYPDNRRILNLIDYFSKQNNSINEGILANVKGESVDTLFTLLAEFKSASSFKGIRKWCADHSKQDFHGFYDKLYSGLESHVSPSDIPAAILIINDYQRWDTSVLSKEVHLASLCLELVTSCDFK